MQKCNRQKKLLMVLVFCTLTTLALQAQVFTTLLTFDGTDGATPLGPLIQGPGGKLYGTTQSGGSSDIDDQYGTVFGITPAGELNTLHSFEGSDGEYPDAALVLATNGNFYGTTTSGGAYRGGTVFEISPEGKLTTLYNFCTQPDCTDGDISYAGMVQAANGNLYGTTLYGGAHGSGNVFEITPAGKLTSIYSFCTLSNCDDGNVPYAGVIQAANGNFYGTTTEGGANCLPADYCGTVFELTSAGKLTTLHSFCSETNCGDGALPYSNLIQGTDGNFYGLTVEGGSGPYCPAQYSNHCGTVFKITPAGTLTTLHSFCSQVACADGANPYASLIQGANGNFYGTTSSGGAKGLGSVFKITSSGKLTTLYSFCPELGCPDGDTPFVGLLRAANGILYGSTPGYGPIGGDGTIFALRLTNQ